MVGMFHVKRRGTRTGDVREPPHAESSGSPAGLPPMARCPLVVDDGWDDSCKRARCGGRDPGTSRVLPLRPPESGVARLAISREIFGNGGDSCQS